MISILFLSHVTSLLRAVSGSHLILCLKAIGITWSPEQNDSLRFFKNYLQWSNVRAWAGRCAFYWCTVAVTQLGGGGGAARSVSALPRVNAVQLGWGWRGPRAPAYKGVWDLCSWGSDEHWTVLKACAGLLGCATPLGWGLSRFPRSAPGLESSPI